MRCVRLLHTFVYNHMRVLVHTQIVKMTEIKQLQLYKVQ